MSYQDRVFAWIRRYEMIRAQDRVVIGLSGGADSVALFFVLQEYQKACGFPFTLCAVHVNHGIRGEQARQDARFCEALCARCAVLFSCVEADVPEIAAESGESIEEAARRVRYEALRSAFPDRVKIAVAHHLDDQAETVLFQMARGSGLKGLCGMRPVAGEIIRPLLCVSRAENEAYLAALQEPYVTDGSNADETYSRNRIRNQVMPRLAEVNERAARHIAAAAQDLGELDDYLETQTEAAYRACTHPTQTGGLLLEEAAFQEMPGVLRTGVIRKALIEVVGSAKDVSRAHLEAVEALFEKQAGRQLALPYGLRVYRVAQGVRMEREMMPETADSRDFEMELLPASDFCANIPKKDYTKYFDYDKIENGVSFRTRQQGDYLTIDGEGHTKTLARYMVDEKLDVCDRERIPLVCDGAHVMWVVGGRISAYYKVSADTKRICAITYKGGTKSG